MQNIQTVDFLFEVIVKRHVCLHAVWWGSVQSSSPGCQLEVGFKGVDPCHHVVWHVVVCEDANDLRHVVAEVVQDGAHRLLHVLAGVHWPIYPFRGG